MNIQNYINLNKVEKAINVYLKAKRMLSYRDYGAYGLNEYMENCSKECLKNTVDYIDFVISRLDNLQREIIYKDFIEVNNNNWWADTYSKSSYYRIRNAAINKFAILLGENSALDNELN